MDDDFFEQVGITSRRSFVKRAAAGAAALVGLSGGALLRPGAAFADPPGVHCNCVDVELHSIDCEECPVCCANELSCVVETFVGKSCANHNVICWWMTSVLCVCCCG